MVDLESSLEQITTYKEYAKGYLCRCPFAPKTHSKKFDRSPSLVVWPEINRFVCYSCGQKGKIKELFLDLARLIPTELHEQLANKWQDSLYHITVKLKNETERETIYLNEEILEHFPPVQGKGKDYLLLNRGVAEEAILHYNIRWDDRSKRVVFPLRDRAGRLLGLVGRNIEKKEHFKYFCETTKTLGGEDKLQYERIVVVEGFMDLLRAWPWANELGLDIVCCWTATLSDTHINTLAKLDKYVYLMLDQDAAGNKGANKFAKVYPGLSTRLQWNFENEKGEISDVGDFTEQQFRGFFECSNAV